MERSYGTSATVGDQIHIIPGASTPVAGPFAMDAGVVGGMNVDDGDAEAGEAVTLNTLSDAVDEFGEESELYYQSRLALRNGAERVIAVGVEETEIEAESLEAGGTLENFPIFDPTVHPDHEISVSDGMEDIDVEIVYDDADVDEAAENTVIINPITGSYDADETGYDIDYTFGAYESAIDAIADASPRSVAVCTEDESLGDYLAGALEDVASDFEFAHGYIGAPRGSAANYEHDMDEPRASIVHASRAMVGDQEVRTLGAVAGEHASLRLGKSSTNNTIRGIDSLVDNFSPQEASELADNRVMPVIYDGVYKVFMDQTTSMEANLSRVYANEIVDEGAHRLHNVNDGYIGEPQTDANLENIAEAYHSTLTDMRRNRDPPLLDGFTVTLDTSGNNVIVTVGYDVIGIIDRIETRIIVGEVSDENEGAI